MKKNTQKNTSQYGIAVCTLDAKAALNGQIQLTPVGAFRGNDGRPTDAVHWFINDSIAAAAIEQANTRTNDFVLDYEHQTLRAKENGKPAPAAGWFKQLEWRADSGLWSTDVRLTDNARELIEKDEYRFISPVFLYRKDTGEVLAILMAALTNNPAIDGMSDLTSLAAANFSFEHPETTNPEVNPMDPELLALLGLDENASVADCAAAIKALQQEQVAALKEKDTAIADLTLQLKDAGGEPDTSKYVPIAVVNNLQTQVAALTADQDATKHQALMDDGLAQGKILPATQAWAESLSVADLSSYLDAAPANPALAGSQSTAANTAAAAASEDGQLTDEQIAMCSSMGISQDDFKATLEAHS